MEIRPKNKNEAIQLAYKNGWRIPKDRHDLHWAEIVDDNKFWQCLVKGILSQ